MIDNLVLQCGDKTLHCYGILDDGYTLEVQALVCTHEVKAGSVFTMGTQRFSLLEDVEGNFPYILDINMDSSVVLLERLNND